MKKWVIPLLLILSLTLTISVHALEPKISLVTPKLSFDGTTANCEVSINELGKEINATLELWCGSTLVDSWTNKGTTRVTVEGSCSVTKGKTYTLKTYGTVDGVSFTGRSVSKTC